jgi:hypothetical protein
MSRYTEEQLIRLMALPTVVLLAVLMMSVTDAAIKLRDVIEGMDFIPEVKQAYPDNVLIQGIFADPEYPLRALHLSSLSDHEAVWRALRLYSEDVGALMGVDSESTEFRAFLAALVQKLAKDVASGLFGHDPAIIQAQRNYLRTIELQFRLVPSNPLDNTLL